MQLTLVEVVGQVAHGISPQRSDVGELASLLPPQGSYPFNHVIGDLHHACQHCNTRRQYKCCSQHHISNSHVKGSRPRIYYRETRGEMEWRADASACT